MVTPCEKEEFKESEEWARKAREGQLAVIPCVATWMDVCGFGSALEQGAWNLVELQKSGLLNLLSTVYQRAGHPFLIGVEPMPYEKVLIINDGIARAVDLGKPEYGYAHLFILYLREIFFKHRSLVDFTRRNGYGFRTIIAGGERVQYSPEIFTGNSVLLHDGDQISEFGKALLNKNFVHNPSEFQMNTAFAKAYSLDTLGSKSRFSVDRCYIEASFFNKVGGIPGLDIKEKEFSFLLLFNSNPAFEIYTDKVIKTTFKGIEMSVYQVVGVRVDECFEGEETYCDVPEA